LTLSPLTQADINHLVADALLCDLEIAAPLSQLIYQKTQGNPFFTTQFLQGLYEDGWITFNQNALYWQCDLSELRQLALTDNVLEFMVGRLRKLPEETQEVLKLAACIGNQFDLETLALACDRPESEVADHLWTALPEGFVVPQSETYKLFQAGDRYVGAKHSESQSFMSTDESIAGMLRPYVAVKYRFLHDRIQQAAYSLIPENLKQSTHLKIGQKLLDRFAEEDPEKRIFELVNQLNYGQHLITDLQQRLDLAQLNFTAGEKAKNSTAYQAAAIYLGVGMQLLGKNAWDCDYILTRNIYTLATEVAYLNGDFAEMEMLARLVLRHGQTLVDKIPVYETLIVGHIVQNQQLLAVKTALSVLQQLGISLPEQPTTADFTHGLEEVNQNLQGCPIENLVNLPSIGDRNIAAGMRILASIFSAAYVTVPALVPLIAFKIVNLSIQYGNAPDSAFGYSLHGLILCGVLGDIKSGYAYGQVAQSLLERGQAKGYQAKVREIFATFIQHWQESLQATLPLLMQSYKNGLEEGDLEFSGYSLSNYAYHSFWFGKNLKDLSQEIASHNEALAKINQNVAQTHHKIHWQTLLNLLGEVENPQILVGQVYDATEMQSWHEEKGDLTGLAFLSLCQMFLSYLFGDAATAATHSATVSQYLGALIGSSCIGVFHFYDSLVQLANLDPELTTIPEEILDLTNANQEKIAKWAEYAPMNYQHKFDLVAAEKYRLLGETLKAMEFYDRAIAGAKENRYLQEEALANELAAKFYLAWGKEKVAAGYLTDAYYCYARWGAVAKTQQLEAKYPQLLTPILQKQRLELNHASLELITQTILSSTKTQSSSSEISDTLDFASLIQAAQALSSIIELNPLFAEICRIILTNAGAEKVVLVIPDRAQWQLRAIAQITSNGTVTTSTATEPLTPESPVPIRLIQYVKNTGKTVLINEGKTQISGIIEGYLLQYQPQSIFCLPLLSQGQLMAILYLEHSTTKGVFTLNRQAIIQFICTQAAISLQNAQLYDRTQHALQELQQAQLQIVQSEKMSALGNLVAGIAHEINNPTGFLEGNIKPAKNYLKDLFYLIDVCLTKCDLQDPDVKMAIEEIDLEFVRDDFLHLLDSMELGIDRLKNISKSLRIFSRKDREEKTAFNLREGIDSTLLILQHRTKANQERPEINIVKNYQIIPEVKCFPGQLNQVFMNILANAVDAFDEKNQGQTYAEIKAHPNQIAISLLPLANNRVKIQIQDNAGGMKSETLKHLFEQGFTTKEIGKGTGLGMAISYQIITEKHGGTIECASTLGEGSTFTITIPIGEESENPQ
jgi:predicted ATPase/signal transduction histidine kinase